MTQGSLGWSNLPRFAVQVIKGRWFMLFASFLIMAGAGATYLFGTYSKDLKSTLGYTQSTLNLLGVFKDFGANVGVMSGLLAEVTPTWFVLLVGSAMNFAGYFMIWLAVTGKISKPKVWQMCLYICMGANSQNFANTGALVKSVQNFPENRGIMLGLLKGYVGLSGAMFNQLYLAIYGNDSKSLILLIAWLPAALSVVFVFVIRDLKVVRGKNDLRCFYHFLWISIALALFLMVATLLEQIFKNLPRGAYAGIVTVVCILLLFPLYVAVREEWDEYKLKKGLIDSPPEGLKVEMQPTAEPMKEELSIPSSPKQEKKKERSCFLTICDKPPRGEDYTILQALLSLDMGILFLATLFGLGSSLAVVDNLGQIGESLGYPKETVSAFVSLLSIWNYFGRVFSGFVSERLVAEYKIPRPLVMTFVLSLASIGYLLIAFPFPGSVYIASIISGFTFGAQLPLLFAIISELFGLKYYSTLFNCGQLASPLGSYILNVQVTGRLYDKEATRQLAKKGLARVAGKELTCLGTKCYQLSFIILALGTFSGALASLWLVARTRQFYRGDIYKKYRENAAS